MIDWLKREHTNPEIDLGEVTLPIALKRHHAAKRLTMRLAPDGSEVRVTLPKWAPTRDALSFVRDRRTWLITQLAKVPDRSSPEPGGEIAYRGRSLTIVWEAKAPRKPSIAGGSLVAGGPLDKLETRLRRWLEDEALDLIEEDMREYCEAADLQPVPVGLSRAQRRWGSCSSKSRIRINWRLIQAPDFVRRSVVAHEVAHLVHFDHSAAFHALLGEIYEGDIREADRWLKVNGRSLYAQFG